jgi:hypothetical protein
MRIGLRFLQTRDRGTRAILNLVRVSVLNKAPPAPAGSPEWVFREIAYCTFCNKEIMKIETHARAAENPRARAARTLLVYFAVTGGEEVRYSTVVRAAYAHICAIARTAVHSCVPGKSIYSCTVPFVTAK